MSTINYYKILKANSDIETINSATENEFNENPIDSEYYYE
jgi:hypothetical protein